MGVVVWVALHAALPYRLAATLLPPAAGAACGLLGSLALATKWNPGLRDTLRLVAVAIAIPAVALPVLLHAQPHALDRAAFWWWMPFVAFAGLFVWVGAYVRERRGRRADPWFTAVLGGIAICAVVLSNGKYVRDAMVGEHLRTWNVYHYYLGAKYFAELGYEDLYAATLAADDEWQQRKRDAGEAERRRLDEVPDFGHIEFGRDMQTYRVLPREQIVAGFDRSAFTDERWAEFGDDTRRLRPRLETDQWHQVLTDWGYNPAPPRTVLDTPVSNVIELDHPAFLLIANSDLPLFVGMFLALWWAFGLRVALVATIWANTIHFNRGRFAGGFWQYDWLTAVVLSLALYHKNRPRIAGVVLSWAVMTRLFPVLLILPILVRMVVQLCQRQSQSNAARAAGRRLGRLLGRCERRHRQLLVALGLSCAVLFGLSHLTGRGLESWPEWIDNIELHRQVVPLDARQVGAGRLAQHDPTPLDPWGSFAGTVDQRLAAGSGRLWVYQVLGLALLVPALLKRRDEDAMVLMLFGAFLLVTMTRYYGTIWLLLFTLGAPTKDGRSTKPALFAGAALLAMAASYYFLPGSAARYYTLNYEALATFAGLCLGYIIADVRRWRCSEHRIDAPAPPH